METNDDWQDGLVMDIEAPHCTLCDDWHTGPCRDEATRCECGRQKDADCSYCTTCDPSCECDKVSISNCPRHG